eukprot:3744392-Alexandrium_andersonii.AAC.1
MGTPEHGRLNRYNLKTRRNNICTKGEAIDERLSGTGWAGRQQRAPDSISCPGIAGPYCMARPLPTLD